MTNILRKVGLLFIISLLYVGTMCGQSLRAYVKAADNAFNKGEYFTAFVYYKKVLGVEPERNDIRFKYAEAARLFQTYRVAEDAYHKITLSKDSLNYPLATYWLGSVKKSLGKYDEASQVLNEYLTKHKRVNARFTKRAEQDIIDCEWAAKMAAATDINISVSPLEAGVNTPFSEFGAFERDGKIYFSSMRFQDKTNQPYSKLMMKNEKGEVESFDFNKEGKFTANAAMSFDGTRLYYTNCDYDKKGNIKCGIVYREKNYYGDWGEEKDLPTFINFPGFTTTHPTIGFDKINKREILFFSSNRPGGKGKLDIWYSTIAANGKLTRPINHALINSRENDVTPYFHSPSQTLYFSSDGYPGMGGYDIYKVKRNGRSWQTPVHMIYPVNTSYNDFYFTLNEKGTQSYFASNREEALEIDPANEACCNDIFTANIAPDAIELTKEEFLAIVNKKEPSYVEVIPDEPRVIIKTQPTSDPTDIPESILNKNNKPDPKATDVVMTVPSGNPTTKINDPTEDPNILKPKGNSPSVVVESNEPTNSGPANSNSDLVFENDFENLPRDIYSLVFIVETMDMELEPLNGVTVEFIEKSGVTGSKNFRRSNVSGNKIQFRIKDDVDYKIVLAKPGFITDTFTIDQEILLGATELTQPFFLNPLPAGGLYPDSPLSEELEEVIVTEDNLKSFLPIPLYFNNDEPDPTSWSNTTNKNYEQTFLLYHSLKENFKDKYARKFADSQREEALDQIDYFFENDLKKGYQDLSEFSNNLMNYLEAGNKVTIVFQPYTTSRATGEKNNALIKRRISCLKNHFKSFLAGKFNPYIDTEILVFETLEPIISPSQSNGIYSPETSKQRKVEIKILKFNDF